MSASTPAHAVHTGVAAWRVSSVASLRAPWVDVCKGLGMLLVFFGHELQVLVHLGYEGARQPFHLIYAFHMPMFFMMAGFFFRGTRSWHVFVWRLALRRLLPVLFFSALLLPAWVAGPALHHLRVWPILAPQVEGYVQGYPELNWVTWFLVCLFICECLARVLLPYVRGLFAGWLFGLACIVSGAVWCSHAQAWAHLVGMDGHVWFLREAVVGLGFYAIGRSLFPVLCQVADREHWPLVLFAVGGCLMVLLLPANAPTPEFVVMMSSAQHGQPLAFAVTALAGSVAVLGLGMVLARSAPMHRLREIGQHSVIWLGLNGAFFHFANAALARHLPPGQGAAATLVYAVLVSAGSVLLCWPLARLLYRWVPQLVGYPQQQGPLLPALEG